MTEKIKTKGDTLREMSDEELAKFIDGIEKDAYGAGIEGGHMVLGKANIDFWTGYFGSEEGKDY